MQSEEKYHLKDTIIEQFRRLMGWCPQAQQRMFRRESAMDTADIVPTGSDGGMPTRSFGWKNRYRTRALAFALCMTGVGISLFAISTGDRFAMFGIGVVLATLLYCADAVSYWDVFRDVERNGVADEKNWKEVSVVRILPIIGAALILAFVGAILLGLIPGLSMLMVNGFLAGFAACGWYHVLTIIMWELRSGIPLYTDGNLIYRRT
jgi:hypothetical protein